mmetsp:Transcript_54715/g.143244  ORF Transcript_54715/g.143244 Transcript_54715/m.143244 type:complete len:95 (+) Transcript_54715:2-286(+)
MDSQGLVTSIGSAAHATGECKPCIFYRQIVGCAKGADCLFCHIRHARQERRRLCKSKRHRYKKLIQAQVDAMAEGEALVAGRAAGLGSDDSEEE